MGLDDFFAIGPGAGVSAQDTFTNRAAELAVFEEAVTHQHPNAPVETVEDLQAPRRNVLVYYGLGGIGKSSLSRELRRRHTAVDDQLALGVDFDDNGASDVENVLLGLRATLGAWGSAWPAFDLAFAAYWERAHPGVALSAVADTYSAVRRSGAGGDVVAQIQTAVEQYLEAPGGSIGLLTTGARAIGRGLREWIRARRVLRDCPFFAPIMDEEDPAQVRGYLAALLAWDLAQVQERRRSAGLTTEVVVFLDTWERVQESEAVKGGAEDLLARLVFLMPNVLFVITGRNRLRWGDPDAVARYSWAGPERWPNLVDATPGVEPRQHLVGGLSRIDAEDFLVHRLVAADQAPAIPADVRDAIVSASGGLPLYLDLAAVRFAQIIARGEVPTVAQFGEPFPEVVLRLMRDLEPHQRTVLRIASLLPRFDEELVLRAAPQLTDSNVMAFVRRSLVAKDPDPEAPFTIHETLRDAVAAVDLAEDRWTVRERDRAIDQLLDELHRRAGPLLAAQPLDPGSLLTIFEQSWHLALRRGTTLPAWLWALAARARSAMGWSILTRAAGSVEAGSQLAVAGRVLAGVAQRRVRGAAATAVELEACRADPDLDPVGREFAGLWLAWATEDTGRRQAADALRLELARGTGVFAPRLRHAVGRSDWVHGRLSRAESWAFDDDDPFQRRSRLALTSRVAWIRGRFDEAAAMATERMAITRAIGVPEDHAHALRTRAEILCWSGADVSDDAENAIELYRRDGNAISAAAAEVAWVVGALGSESLPTVLERLERARAAVVDGPEADMAEVFARLVHDDPAGAERVRARLLRPDDAFGYAAVITGWWLGDDDPADVTATVDWGEYEAGARESWRAQLHGCRQAVRASGG